jgi:23S rRNA (cytosine1962-C5)-methyltransferase
VDRIDGPFTPGDIVRVVTNDGKFLAKGFINPQSQILTRIVCFEDLQIDSAFFRERLQNPIDLRKQYINSADTAYRLVYGEGDQLSGLVVDKYDTNLVIQIFSLGMDKMRDDLLQWLADLPDVNCIIERSEGDSRKYEGLSPHKAVLRGDF